VKGNKLHRQEGACLEWFAITSSPHDFLSAGAYNRTFVHYAHLQRNSVTVKAGQAVRRGQVIGRLGNSGNTNAAHLHFNITDDPSPEAAQGLPFVFDAFESPIRRLELM
jgi:hypothetical protein